jgi:hypothetical protein
MRISMAEWLNECMWDELKRLLKFIQMIAAGIIADNTINKKTRYAFIYSYSNRWKYK